MALCHPSDRTVASGVVGIVVVVAVAVVVIVIIVIIVGGICNHSQMRTSKCTCLFFGVSIGLDHSRKAQKEFLIEIITGKKMNIL